MPEGFEEQARVRRVVDAPPPQHAEGAPDAAAGLVVPPAAAEHIAEEGATPEESVDQAIEMTFPASDPPAWMSSGGRPAAAAEAVRGKDGA